MATSNPQRIAETFPSSNSETNMALYLQGTSGAPIAQQHRIMDVVSKSEPSQNIEDRRGEHPGLLEGPNINLNLLNGLKYSDGRVEALKPIIVQGVDSYIVLPTIIDGVKVSKKEAIKHYNDTQMHLGKFDSEENAIRFSDWIEESQSRLYKD